MRIPLPQEVGLYIQSLLDEGKQLRSDLEQRENVARELYDCALAGDVARAFEIQEANPWLGEREE